MIIIQHIKTIWTKKSRGMPGAGKRNAVPKKLLFPNKNNNEDSIFLHEIVAQEWNDFQLEEKTEEIKDRDRYWSFTLQQNEDQLQIYFYYNWAEHGAPDRGAYQRPQFNLKLGQTGSLHINGRFVSYDDQYYVSHFVNIANVDRFNRDLFVINEPNYLIDQMVRLF